MNVHEKASHCQDEQQLHKKDAPHLDDYIHIDDAPRQRMNKKQSDVNEKGIFFYIWKCLSTTANIKIGDRAEHRTIDRISYHRIQCFPSFLQG